MALKDNKTAKKKKGMSFGMMLGLFAGFFVLIVVIAVIWMLSTQPKKEQVTSRKVELRPAQQQQQSPNALLEMELAKAQREAELASNEKKAVEAQIQDIRQEYTRTNDILIQELKRGNERMAAMEQRLYLLSRPQRKVEVVKPPRKPREPTQAQKLAAAGKPLPEAAGYKVQAAVGDRAWVRTGNNEESVRPGDRILEASKQPLKEVIAVDSSSGVVIIR